MEFPLPTNIFLRGLKKFEILIPWGFDFGGKLGDFGDYASKAATPRTPDLDSEDLIFHLPEIHDTLYILFTRKLYTKIEWDKIADKKLGALNL